MRWRFADHAMTGFMTIPLRQPILDCSGEPSRKMTEEWLIFDDVRPWTANAERTWNHYKRAEVVRETRLRFGWKARSLNIPLQNQIVVIARPHRKDRRSMPDVGACFPTVKAAIDGIVDAGVIPNDTPQHLLAIVFYAPIVSGKEGLSIRIVPANRYTLEISKEISDIGLT
jgi:crossover junction endodeoxyribonuclease RusA